MVMRRVEERPREDEGEVDDEEEPGRGPSTVDVGSEEEEGAGPSKKRRVVSPEALIDKTVKLLPPARPPSLSFPEKMKKFPHVSRFLHEGAACIPASVVEKIALAKQHVQEQRGEATVLPRRGRPPGSKNKDHVAHTVVTSKQSIPRTEITPEASRTTLAKEAGKLAARVRKEVRDVAAALDQSKRRKDEAAKKTSQAQEREERAVRRQK